MKLRTFFRFLREHQGNKFHQIHCSQLLSKCRTQFFVVDLFVEHLYELFRPMLQCRTVVLFATCGLMHRAYNDWVLSFPNTTILYLPSINTYLLSWSTSHCKFLQSFVV